MLQNVIAIHNGTQFIEAIPYIYNTSSTTWVSARPYIYDSSISSWKEIGGARTLMIPFYVIDNQNTATIAQLYTSNGTSDPDEFLVRAHN